MQSYEGIAETYDGGTHTIQQLAEDDPNDPADVSENKWLVWTLDAEQAAKGDHQVKVILVNRDSRIRPPLIVNHLEIHVRYEGTS